MPRKKIVGATPEETPVVAPVEPTVEPVVETPVVKSKYKYPELESENVKVRQFSPGSLEDTMYKHFCSLPKVPFYCPLNLGEAPGAWQWYQHNGLVVEVKKGTMAMIPQQIAEELMESLKMTSDALNPIVLSEGKPVPANIAYKSSAKEFTK